MKTNVINILADVFKLITTDQEVLKTPKVLTSKLKDHGIEEKDLLSAMFWLVSFLNYDEKLYDAVPHGRIFTDIEINRLGENGIEYLSRLTAQGVLTPGRKEFLIDKIMTADTGPLDLKQLKIFTFLSLAGDKKRPEEIKWIEAVVLKETSEQATLLH